MLMTDALKVYFTRDATYTGAKTLPAAQIR